MSHMLLGFGSTALFMWTNLVSALLSKHTTRWVHVRCICSLSRLFNHLRNVKICKVLRWYSSMILDNCFIVQWTLVALAWYWIWMLSLAIKVALDNWFEDWSECFHFSISPFHIYFCCWVIIISDLSSMYRFLYMRLRLELQHLHQNTLYCTDILSSNRFLVLNLRAFFTSSRRRIELGFTQILWLSQQCCSFFTFWYDKTKSLYVCLCL